MKRMLARWLMRDESVLSAAARTTHTYMIGQPGTGKSRALEAWAMQDILAGRGVGVIDPHGDLFRNLVTRLASHPDVWDRVIIIDPTDRNWVVNVDPLQPMQYTTQQRLALFMTDIIVKIWRIDPAQAPRMVWLLTNSFLALADLGLTLLDLPRFLLDSQFRESLLPRVTREEVLMYFHLEFPKSDAAIRQWVTPVLNKIGGLVWDPDVRLMLGGRKPLNMRMVLDTQRVLLVNLPKGILGEGTSSLLGALLISQLQKAALSRAETRFRPPFYLYLDEFQQYTTDNITQILSESRKYTLSLTLAHQFLDQLAPELREAVLSTSGTLVSFRVGYQDAWRLAKELFPSPAAITRTTIRGRRRSLGGLPFFTVESRQTPLGWDGLAQSIANLPDRQFWFRRRGSRLYARERTLNMPDPSCSRAERKELYDATGARYGRRRRDAEHELYIQRRGSGELFGRYTAPSTPPSGNGSTGEAAAGTSIWSE